MRESFLTIPLFSRIIFSGSLNSQRFDKHSSQNIPTSLSNNTYPSHLSLPRLSPPLSIIITEYARATLRQKPRYRVFPITRRHLSTKSEMIFFFLHFQAECEQRVDDVTRWWFPAGSYVGESPQRNGEKGRNDGISETSLPLVG